MNTDTVIILLLLANAVLDMLLIIRLDARVERLEDIAKGLYRA